MSSIAYALRAEYLDSYLGGVVAVGTGSLDIKAALDEGDGQIVVPEDEHLTVCVLDDYPALERTTVKKPAAKAAAKKRETASPDNADTTEA